MATLFWCNVISNIVNRVVYFCSYEFSFLLLKRMYFWSYYAFSIVLIVICVISCYFFNIFCLNWLCINIWLWFYSFVSFSKLEFGTNNIVMDFSRFVLLKVLYIFLDLCIELYNVFSKFWLIVFTKFKLYYVF